MKIDGNIGGAIDGTGGGDIGSITDQVRDAERVGLDGVWTTEISHDPFLPVLLAADRAPELTVGTSIAVAFARNPMTVAVAANDLQSFSGGRFVLGLGTQIKAHIERRFGMPWSDPAQRMREFVEALHAIWANWQTGAALDFRGRYYQHTLMTPMFTPDRNPWGPPPILLAAVGRRMTQVAAEVGDGLIVHGFTTQRYLAEVTLPLITDTLRRTGRDRQRFTVSYPGLLAVGDTDEALARAAAAVRQQLAFYGSTPAYRAVLDLHGWGELHTELRALSVRGRWSEMTDLIDDEILRTFAVVGAPEQAGREIVGRYGGLVDRFTLYTPYLLPDPVRSRLVQSMRAAATRPTLRSADPAPA
jgi:probable F420-dependent oxidoreductase